MTKSSFRRVWIQAGAVHVAQRGPDGADVVYHLPNPTSTGQTYDPERIRSAVIKAQKIDPAYWTTGEEKETP